MKIEKRDDYNSGHKCTWCPGCGNFSIWYMLKQALLELNINPHEVVIVYDVGCNGNGSNFTKTYGFHGLHGRAIPLAQGVKLANENLKVISIGGDGGTLGLGAGHLIHAARRNIDITCILHDNQIYGLTTGQTSPRSDKGMKTKTTPYGNIEEPINPINLALTAKASFIGRSFSGNPHHLKEMLKEAISHKGFSLLDILQPCITFNKTNTYAWYNERVYDLKEDKNYDQQDLNKAWIKGNEWGDRIPLGIFYKEDKPTYQDLMGIKYSALENMNLENIDITSALQKYSL